MKRAWLVICLVACGNSHAHVTADAPPIDAPPANNAVTLSTFGVPDFIAFRNGSDGPWQTPTALTTLEGADYDLRVAADYLVVLVCDNGVGTAFDAEEYGFTFAGDGPSVDAFCEEPVSDTADGSAGSATVTGTMQQAGTVQLGGLGSGSATGPWVYTITTTAGMHDVLAIDTANTAVFDKAIDFEGSAAGPAIDTGSGAALVSQPLTINLLGDSELRISDDVCSTDCATVSSGSAALALTMPLSELGTDDDQFFELSATDAISFRFALVILFGPTVPPATYNLLPDFTTASFNGGTASWTTLPAATYTTLNEFIDDAAGNDQVVNVTSSWVVARSATSLSFDASAPGYLPAWQIDPSTGGVDLEQTYDDPSSGVSYSTSAESEGPTAAFREHRKQSFARHVQSHAH
jgi:hypothetical protein